MMGSHLFMGHAQQSIWMEEATFHYIARVSMCAVSKNLNRNSQHSIECSIDFFIAVISMKC